MNDAMTRHHSEAETLAAFVDGKLKGNELAEVSEHLESCEECRMLIGEAARFRREEGGVAPHAVHSPARWWIPAAVAAMIVLAIGAPLVRQVLRGREERNAIQRLADAAADRRTVEGRLTAFQWARLRGVERGSGDAADPNQMKLIGVAGDVLDRTSSARAPELLHARGLAYLAVGRRSDAVEALDRAAKASTDARVWSDLAAARDAVATRDGRYGQLPLALADADRALKLEGRLAQAAFNRGLILEHMGLRDPARRAWQKYLELDSGSPWAAEAREHLKELDPGSASLNFRGDLNRASPAIRNGDAQAAASLAHKYPQEARTWAEGPLLAAWAKTLVARGAQEASGDLVLVRLIARAVATTNGEKLVSDEVDVIDAAASDQDRLRLLATAHIRYDEARVQLNNRSYALAEKGLLDAGDLFARARSPMADVSLYFAANAQFEQNQITDSREHLTHLIARCDRARHMALFGQELWELAHCDALSGSWSAAMDNSLAAVRAFASLRETRNEAIMRAIVADYFDHIAQDDEAWRLRAAAIDSLYREGAADRVRGILANAIRSAIRDRFYESARALADVAVEELQDAGDPLLLADALVQRARIAAELGDYDDTLDHARLAAGRIANGPLRRRTEMDLLAVEGILLRASDPRKAVSEISRAIAFYEQQHFDLALIDAYLQRSKAFAAAGEEQLAGEDIDRAVAELERERSTLSDTKQRSSFFDTAPQVFEEAVSYFIKNRDVNAAFGAAERARARTLSEQLGATYPASGNKVRSSLPTRSILIEYTFVPNGITIFCLRPDRIEAETIDVERQRFASLVDGFRNIVRERNSLTDVRNAAEELDDILLAPVRKHLEGATHIIFVTDHELEKLPFAALVNRASGHYLVEDYAISFAPSATFITRDPGRTIDGALFVGNPAAPDFEPLPAAEREAVTLSRLYRHSSILVRQDASRSHFAELASRSSLIHFAGHARTEDDESPALAFSPADGNDGFLSAADISHLSLQHTAIVSLATCGSAGGRTSHVEGIPSLARAFLTAGVPTVVGTLWNVDDRLSSGVFRTFHQRLSAGDSAARGLQVAQIAALRSGDRLMEHPATWAVIEVLGIGSARPSFKMRESS